MESNETAVLSNAERQKRYRERNKVTDNVTRVTEGITEKVLPELVTPRPKGFSDLPKDVQANIIRVSNMRIGNVEPDPVLVSEEIGRRTQVALHYQKYVRAG